MLEHEIPEGGKLYFGHSAKIKREIEALASERLYGEGFEEIATPTMLYLESSESENRGVIKLSSEMNHQLALRSDSTLEVANIVAHRLDGSTANKRWFYIQPVFRYPSTETNQIGAEIIGSGSIGTLLGISWDICAKAGVVPDLILANMQLPLKIAAMLELDITLFTEGNIEQLSKSGPAWLKELVAVEDYADLERISLPEPIADEAAALVKLARECKIAEAKVAPLFYSNMRYHDGLYFKMYQDNSTLVKGGCYKIEGIESAGFSLYTDEFVQIKTEKSG